MCYMEAGEGARRAPSNPCAATAPAGLAGGRRSCRARLAGARRSGARGPNGTVARSSTSDIGLATIRTGRVSLLDLLPEWIPV